MGSGKTKPDASSDGWLFAPTPGAPWSFSLEGLAASAASAASACSTPSAASVASGGPRRRRGARHALASSRRAGTSCGVTSSASRSSRAACSASPASVRLPPLSSCCCYCWWCWCCCWCCCCCCVAGLVRVSRPDNDSVASYIYPSGACRVRETPGVARVCCVVSHLTGASQSSQPSRRPRCDDGGAERSEPPHPVSRLTALTKPRPQRMPKVWRCAPACVPGGRSGV